MGMSTHVIGFKPPDETWQRMKAVWDACEAAGIDLPAEVDHYFQGERPDPAGVEVPKTDLVKLGALREWDVGDSEGYEVELEKLPADIKILRFFNSW